MSTEQSPIPHRPHGADLAEHVPGPALDAETAGIRRQAAGIIAEVLADPAPEQVRIQGLLREPGGKSGTPGDRADGAPDGS